MRGRTASRSLPQQNLARVAFEQKGFGDEQAVEHLDDVAVLQHEFRTARSRMVPVPQRRRSFEDLVLRERRAIDALGAEETHHRTTRAQDADDLTRERTGRFRIEEIEDVPAQDPVDAGVGLREALRERLGERVLRAGADLTIDLAGEILDEQLAAEVLAEEGDVGADDRTKIDEYRRLVVRERADELGERLGGNDGVGPFRRGRVRRRAG